MLFKAIVTVDTYYFKKGDVVYVFGILPATDMFCYFLCFKEGLSNFVTERSNKFKPC